MDKNNKANIMWGGHFSKSPDQVMQDINASIDFDKKLYQEDIAGSIAHVKMLAKQKIITKDESLKIISGLNQIKKEILENKFVFDKSLEDIHMNIENRLKDLIGDVAGKLHTARSRNDQVATDFKIFVRKANQEILLLIKNLIRDLATQAENNTDVILPGYTHLQAAQPVSLAHHFLAYIEMLGRDLSRFTDANKRLDECPLGAAALAGTSFPIDRDFTAQQLGFSKASENSLDTVSDRDFALDFLSNSSIIITHLSRLAEELILWVSQGFNFISLSESFTTGSSIMPQKRNPDGAELMRGKTGRVYGNLMSLLTVIKSLPLAYSKDLQEDKEPVFDSYETIISVLKIASGMVQNLTINKENMLKATDKGFITATDLADYLVKNLNMPFRNAHHTTGKIVVFAEKNNLQLHQIKLTDLQKIEPLIKEDIYDILKVENSVISRDSYGGTSPKQIKQALQRAIKKYL
jgi:argininosuccinate lyase